MQASLLNKWTRHTAICAMSLILGTSLCTVPVRAQTPTPAPATTAVPVPMNEIYPLGKAWPAPNVKTDITAAPEASAWAEEAKTLVQQWFPIVCRYLDTDGYKPPKTYVLVFKDNMDGVAYTTGMGKGTAETVISEKWIASHPDDFGMVIHEMTHVIQGYSDKEYGAAGWLVEGIADYVRFYKYEPDVPRREVEPQNPEKATYHDAYRTTASFIAYVTWKYDRGTLYKIDAALRAGTYSDDIWRTITGKDVETVWQEYVQFLEAAKSQ
jgi:hypothetical protein